MSNSLLIKILSFSTIMIFSALPAYAGGGGWFIKPLGLMLGGAMLLTILFTKISS
mgnify:CR=1 FL=1